MQTISVAYEETPLENCPTHLALKKPEKNTQKNVKSA